MPLIEVRGLTKLYRMGDSIVRALDGVDLSVEPGEFIAITGPSGSGKSTMMHLLGCLDRPTAGEYLLNGQRVSDLSDRELAAIRNRHIGFVFQTFNLINRTTALENVAVPLFYARQSNTRTAAREALERVGLAHRANHRPSELSGGERQRVAIARAIVNNPKFLLADEPTGNLDTRTGEQIMRLFHELNAQGVTIVLVTHEPDIAIQARRIVQMRDGRIVADRPSAELLRSGGPPRPDALPSITLPVTPAPDEAVAGLPDGPGPERLAAVPHASPRLAGATSGEGLPRRLAAGANATLACGILAIASVLAALVLSAFIPRPNPGRGVAAGPAPSPSTSLLALLTSAAMLAGIVCGAIAIFWSRGVTRRIRSEPGNWAGRGRARTGALLGWLVVALPVLSIGYGIVARLVAGRH